MWKETVSFERRYTYDVLLTINISFRSFALKIVEVAKYPGSALQELSTAAVVEKIECCADMGANEDEGKSEENEDPREVDL